VQPIVIDQALDSVPRAMLMEYVDWEAEYHECTSYYGPVLLFLAILAEMAIMVDHAGCVPSANVSLCLVKYGFHGWNTGCVS
jgi:hypothetical protein